MTIENHPTARTPILRDAIIVEDQTANEAKCGPILTEQGNPILDENGRVIYDD